MGRNKAPGLIRRGGVWHVEKCIGGTRLRGSTGTRELAEAEAILAAKVEAHRKALIFGVRPERSWRQAATKYLTEEPADKASLPSEAQLLRVLDRYIGELRLDQVHGGTLESFVKQMRAKGRKASTINRYLAVVRRILNLAARYWRDPATGLTWLEFAPLLRLEKGPMRRPYPLDWAEQRLLFGELPAELAEAALFAVHTGLRNREVCALRWDWQVADDLFVLPAERVKNGEERLVVLNATARKVVAARKGKGTKRLFPRMSLYTSAWKRARARAAAKYQATLGRPCPDGFASVRVHDLRHTFGRRLRAAGVAFEDRQDLLGHKSGRITTHYSVVEVEHLREAVRKIEGENPHNFPTLKVVGGSALR